MLDSICLLAWFTVAQAIMPQTIPVGVGGRGGSGKEGGCGGQLTNDFYPYIPSVLFK